MDLKVLSKCVLFGILMDLSILRYSVKTTSLKDQTMKCAEFSLKNKLV